MTPDEGTAKVRAELLQVKPAFVDDLEIMLRRGTKVQFRAQYKEDKVMGYTIWTKQVRFYIPAIDFLSTCEILDS